MNTIVFISYLKNLQLFSKKLHNYTWQVAHYALNETVNIVPLLLL